ncbi:MAG: DUF5060 domain-containing protein [Candidatus Hydrogenedentes bacterium]|nr:DUF5060 domain-containing protein [Candidatus Hydrogenedentota bacterium]
MKFWPSFAFTLGLFLWLAWQARAGDVFPGAAWEERAPEACGADGDALEALAQRLGGRGCVVKDGVAIKTWGDQALVGDWFSSAKPVLSTLLFFAIEEGKAASVDQPIADFGWPLQERHRGITFRHLGAMSSGYARPEGAGEAWAYNDYAIQLYQKTLFEKVFQQHGNDVAAAPSRLGALQFQEGLKFDRKHRLKASVRDFARVVWFWRQKGHWNGQQVLPRKYFDEYMRPQTPKDLPETAHNGMDDDYLGIASYGGGSDHFSSAGSGIYGFNWWFNDTGRLHPETLTWPDAPKDTIMSIGAGGNSSAFIPSLNAAVICAEGNWGEVEGGNPESGMNQTLKLFAQAVSAQRASTDALGPWPKWMPQNLDFAGPPAQADATAPNPFLDYRLQVTVTAPSGATHNVPGFYAGDGKGGNAGGVWRAIVAPDETGTWQYTVSFREGAGVAVQLEADAGTPCHFDAAQGSFTVVAQDRPAPGFYALGRLEYVGGHYLKFRDGGYWIKGGTDSPEDLLAYTGFANMPKAEYAYADYVADWRPGDPDWGDGAGKGIIGALNYLGANAVNSIYFLTMNIGGDGKNVHPYLEPIDRGGSPENGNLHFDLARLEQWRAVFDHAQRQGIFLHFVLNEAEEPNKRELDDGQLGVERKLYYRELIARFGHLPALQWNLCEEYNLDLKLEPEVVKAFAQYIHDVDPYEHPVTVHHAGKAEKAWAPFVGDQRFPVASFQMNEVRVVEDFWKQSEAAGVPLVIGMDEFFPDRTTPENTARHRREYLWPMLLSGGQIEFILEENQYAEDFRRYEALWQYMAHARRFMQENLPFWEMEPSDELLSGAPVFAGENNQVTGQVFAKADACYAIYLPAGGSEAVLDLSSATGVFVQRWYNPRTGAFAGEAVERAAGGQGGFGRPPGGGG